MMNNKKKTVDDELKENKITYKDEHKFKFCLNILSHRDFTN